tara:strand:- start:14658 stop:16094 length:1437 start_codon:yes stop_codon:yes gene_type:complete
MANPWDDAVNALKTLPTQIGSQVKKAVEDGMKSAMEAGLGQEAADKIGGVVGLAVQGALAQAGLLVAGKAGGAVLDPKQAMTGFGGPAQMAETMAGLEATNRAQVKLHETVAQTVERLIESQRQMVDMGATLANLTERNQIYGSTLSGNLAGQQKWVGLLQKTTQAQVALKTSQEDAMNLQNMYMRQFGMTGPAAAKEAATITLLNKEYKLLPGTMEKLILSAKDTWATLGDTTAIRKSAAAIAQWARDTGRMPSEISAVTEKFATFQNAMGTLQQMAPVVSMFGGSLGDIRNYIGQKPGSILGHLGGAIGSMKGLAPAGPGQPVPRGMSQEAYSQALRTLGSAVPGLGASGVQIALQRRPSVAGEPVIAQPLAELRARAVRATTPMQIFGALQEALVFIRDNAMLSGPGIGGMPAAAVMLKTLTVNGSNAAVKAKDLETAFGSLATATNTLRKKIEKMEAQNPTKKTTPAAADPTSE